MSSEATITGLGARVRSGESLNISTDSTVQSPSAGESGSTPDTEVSTRDVSPGLTKETYFDRSGDSKARALRKAASLSLEEQVSLLTGADHWRTAGIPSKGIAPIKTSDGPNGARGAVFKAGTRAALFPCGVSLAATWNRDLMFEVGHHLAEETKARSAHILLAPTVCLHRGPLGGRNFESFSEDPFLTGKLAVSYINGLQGNGIAATIKHFVANESELERLTMDSVVSERALRELYLKPFEIAIRESKPWALMSSYNLVNGVHADQNEHILKDILRGEWKYDGLVMSDWTGTNSTVEAIEAGCDLEMPYSDKWRGEKAIQAVKSKRLSQDAVEKAAANVLQLIERVRGNDISPENLEFEDNRPETRELIRRAAGEGLTLLKNNDQLLPIKPTTKKIAVIGPNANRAIAFGGGSASLNPYYSTLPLASIKEISEMEVLYSKGCDTYKWLPPASAFCSTVDGVQGLTLEFFDGDDFLGKPAFVQIRTDADLMLWDSIPTEIRHCWSCKINCLITPLTDGKHTFSFMSVGPGRYYLDDKLVADLWDWTEEGEAMFDGSQDVVVDMECKAGVPVRFYAEMTNEIRPVSKQVTMGRKFLNGGCRIGYLEEDLRDHLQLAVDAAKEAEVAIVIVGLDAEWESEGYDRKTMDLPRDGSQDRLIEAVVAANSNTVVVVQAGSPVTMPWANKVPTILQAWYQGQEAGNALADVLFGHVNPSGKLPTTFPVRIEDNPTFHTWPGENKQTYYGEGIFMGYRHYERLSLAPLFPFGHGLSYTSYSYGALTLSSHTLSAAGTIAASVSVTNSGSSDGAETVQFYVRDVQSKLARPVKELAGFEKVWLKAGETKTVTVALDKHSVGYYDTSLASWIAEEGQFKVFVAASSVDIRGEAEFEVETSFTWIF